MRKRLYALLLALALTAGLISAGFAFFGFVARAIYEESTAHLVEIFQQANQALYNLVSVNWSRMRMWEPYLGRAESEADLRAYIDQARAESHFTDFCFISRDGDYCTPEGKQGYLDLREQLSTLILERQPVVVNSVVPDQPEIMVFAVPASPGSYRGFAYEAIAITFNNSDIVDALEISAFDGQAGTFAVLPDGRVIVDNGGEGMRNIYNFLALMENSSSLTGEEVAALRGDFLAGNTGATVFDIDGRDYYLVYEPVGFQDWTVLGVAPADVVNASLNKLQSTTIIVVSGIVAALAATLLLLIMQQNRQKLRRKDNELLARDALFSQLSGNVDDVFLMLDARNLRVDYASPNLEKLLGIPAARVRADVRVLEQLLTTQEDVHILDHLPEIGPGRQMEWDREYVHRATGEVRWFHAVAFRSDIHGEKKYILDVSDRTKEKKVNQALEDAVRTAERASRAKTTFLNNMSHDIRTPMNAIIGFTGIALQQESSPEVARYLRKIGSSAEHLLTLINDVLDISRIESGKAKFAPVPVEIAAVTDTVLSIVQGFLTGRNLTFRTELSAPPAPFVLADAVRLREVLVNILGNAVKFTGDGGTITFEAAYESGADARHITARYRVSDTGVGMSREFVGRIFDEFAQEEDGARTQYKGNGLGMAITKRYVDLMGGAITVESEKGVGSVFTVTLPMELAGEACVPAPAAPAAAADLTGVRVLLAEDNDLNAEIAAAQLETLGIRVTRAANGREAAEAFAAHPPGTFDLIFMDIMMPEMNGYEATAAIRAMPGRPDAGSIPIIAMTANAFAEDVQASLRAGMNGHIAKPIVIGEVEQMIADHVKCAPRAAEPRENT